MELASQDANTAEKSDSADVTPSMSRPPAALMAVAHLLRSQGRRGELLADPLSDLPGIFLQGRSFHLGSEPDQTRPIQLEHCWRPQGRNAGRLVLKLAGVDSISAAELIEGQDLFLEEALLPAREEGSYLVRDLLGCALFDGDRLIGTLVDLQFPIAADGHTRLEDAADLLAIQLLNAPPSDDPVLVPFVKAWLEGVDLAAKRITMHLPPGLLDSTPAE